VITRRSLLSFIPALLAAPAIVRAASLMPVKALPVDSGEMWWLEEDEHEPLLTCSLTVSCAYNLSPGGIYLPEWRRL